MHTCLVEIWTFLAQIKYKTDTMNKCDYAELNIVSLYGATTIQSETFGDTETQSREREGEM